METVNVKKNKGGRPKKPEKKELVIRVRLTKSDHFIIRHKAQKAGVFLSTYMVKMGLNGTVKARLTEEERQYIRKLVGMSNNLNQLVKEFHKAGMRNAVKYVEELRDKVDELLKILEDDK